MTPAAARGAWRRSSAQVSHGAVIPLEQALHAITAIAGGKYVSTKYSEQLAEAGIDLSAGNVGDSYDNALAETINGLYKAQVIHRRGY